MSTDVTQPLHGLSRLNASARVLRERFVVTVRWPRLALCFIWFVALGGCFMGPRVGAYFFQFSFIITAVGFGIADMSGTINVIRTVPLASRELHRLLWFERAVGLPIVAWAWWIPIWICSAFQFGKWTDPFLPIETIVVLFGAAGYLSVASILNTSAVSVWRSNPMSWRLQLKSLPLTGLVAVFVVLSFSVLGVDIIPPFSINEGMVPPPRYTLIFGYFCYLVSWLMQHKLLATRRAVHRDSSFDGVALKLDAVGRRIRDPIFSHALTLGIGLGLVQLPFAFFYRNSEEAAFLVVLAYMLPIGAFGMTVMAEMINLRARLMLPISKSRLALTLMLAPAGAFVNCFVFVAAIALGFGVYSPLVLLPGPVVLGCALVASSLTIRYGYRLTGHAGIISLFVITQVAAILGFSVESAGEYATTHLGPLSVCSVALSIVLYMLAHTLYRRFLSDSAYRVVEQDLRAIQERYGQG